MADDLKLDSVKGVLCITTDETRRCPLCNGYSLGRDMEKDLNHMFKEHGLTLLHIGTETANSDEGPWQKTAAYFKVKV